MEDCTLKIPNMKDVLFVQVMLTRLSKTSFQSDLLRRLASV